MSLAAVITKLTRRALTGHPSSVTPESHNAWLGQQLRAYTVPQYYAGPLSHDNLTGETWEMRLAYRRMLRQPEVKGPLLKKVFAVAQLDAQVIPDDKDDPAQRAAAQYVDWAVRKSSGGWSQLLLNVMLPGLIDGYSLTEKVPAVVPSDEAKYPGFWRLAAGASKDTQTVRFKLDEFKKVVGVYSLAPSGQGGVLFDPGDFILFTFLKVFESPFGMSDLRAAYRDAILIEGAIKLRSILLENFSGPYLEAKAGDAATRQQVGELLAEARARGFIVLPDDATLQVHNLATSAPEQFQSSIEDMRKSLAIGLQGSYLDQVESANPGGQGDSKTHKSVAELFQWYLAVTVASCLTEQLVPDLVVPNFGRRGGRPTITLGGLDPGSIKADLDRFGAGLDLGLELSKSQVMEVGGFESPKDPTDVLRKAPPPTPPMGPGGPHPGGLPPTGGPKPLALPPGPTSPPPPQPPPDPLRFADWQEDKHPRDKGKFASAPGASGSDSPGGSAHASATGQALAHVKRVGSAALDNRVGRFLVGAEHTLSMVAHKTREVAVQAAKNRGLDDDQAARLARTLAIADFVGGYVTGGVTAATVSPILGKAAAFLPSVSALYLGYSAARDAAGTWAAARDVVSRTIGGGVVRHADAADLADWLADQLAGCSPDKADWVEAVFLAALAETEDVAKARTAFEAAMADTPDRPTDGRPLTEDDLGGAEGGDAALHI